MMVVINKTDYIYREVSMAKLVRVFFFFSVFLFFQSQRAIGEGDGLPDVAYLAHMSDVIIVGIGSLARYCTFSKGCPLHLPLGRYTIKADYDSTDDQNSEIFLIWRGQLHTAAIPFVVDGN
jgi:hypothetical protein